MFDVTFMITVRRMGLLITTLSSICTLKARHVTRMGENRSAYRILVGRPEGRRPLGRPRRRREDNIKTDIQEVG
jgi:hypothetical protein